MDNLLFSKSFNFSSVDLRNFHYTDNRKGCDFHFIGLMKKGRAKLVHSAGTIEIKEGDCFYIPINCSYRSFWYGEPEIQFDSYGFTYFPNPDDAKFPIQVINVSNGAEILKDVKTAQNHSCINIGKFYTALGVLTGNMNKVHKTKQDEIISRATDFMQKNASCKMAEVARHCNISESALYYIFREHAGSTPTELRQRLQVEKALILLSSTDLKVETVAEKCGFCSAIYFRKVFKKVTGKLPSQMRKGLTP